MSGPLLLARFDATNSYLASVVVALDSHQVRVQSVNPSQSSLNTNFNLEGRARVSALSWVSVDDQLLIAIALTSGVTLVYSPTTNQTIAELSSPTNLAITDFHYSSFTNTAWLADINGNIYQWDMKDFSLIESFTVTDILELNDSISKVSSILYKGEPHLLIGSHSAYLVDVKTRSVVSTFPAHVQPINSITLVPGDQDLFITSALGERFINLYSVSSTATKTVYVAESSVASVSIGEKDGQFILLVINESGAVEIFNDPFGTPQASESPKRKRRQKVTQSRSSNASVSVARPKDQIKSPADESITIDAITIHEDTFIYSWLENGNVSYFDSIRWFDGDYVCLGSKVVEKLRPIIQATTHAVKGHDVAAPALYNEGNAIISEGVSFKDLDNDSEDEETLADKLEKLTTDNGAPKRKRKLGESTATLAIVLAQSLKNNDHSLLESVLATKDTSVVQNTIARLDSSLAVLLLDRLSERIAKQADRFDELNFWLKWVIIVHGGVMSSLPNLNTKLASLHATLTKKAQTLPRLLELQGRLNLLYQEVELKKEIMNRPLNENDTETAEFEYIEENDDAKFRGEVDSDDEQELVDDYSESDISDEDMAVPDVMDLDGDSDLEIEVERDDYQDDEELAKLELDQRISKLVNAHR